MPDETISLPPVESPAAVGDITINEPATPGDPDQPAAPDLPVPADLREERFAFLRGAVQNATENYAIAASSGQFDAIVKHREEARVALSVVEDSPDGQQLMLNMLGELPGLPVPAEIQADWITLARKILDIWRRFFGHVKPADQAMADSLHSLSSSIEAGLILGTLSQKAQATGHAGNLNSAQFETILDGHQSEELLKRGVQPLNILPLVNAVSHARGMLAAAAEHKKAAGPVTEEIKN